MLLKDDFEVKILNKRGVKRLLLYNVILDNIFWRNPKFWQKGNIIAIFPLLALITLFKRPQRINFPSFQT